MSENHGADAGPGGIDWKREIDATATPLESLRQLVAALENLEAEGVTTGEWVFCIRTEQGGVEFPRIVSSMGSPLVLCALSDLLAKDISSRAILQWATAPAPQRREAPG